MDWMTELHRRSAESGSGRLWSKANKTDSCWEWMGATNRGGYGMLRIGGKGKLAHRQAFEMWYGKKPEGYVCHHCDNRLCINPEHLYDGDSKTNGRDLSMKLAGVDIETRKQLIDDEGVAGERKKVFWIS